MKRRTYFTVLSSAVVLSGCLGDGETDQTEGNGTPVPDPTATPRATDADDGETGESGETTPDRSAGNESQSGSADGGTDDDTSQGRRLDRRWTWDIDAQRVNNANYDAAVGPDRIFVGSEAGLSALGVSDGRELWSSAEWTDFTAVHADTNGVVAYTRDGSFGAFDPSSGDLLWEDTTDEPTMQTPQLLSGVSSDVLTVPEPSGPIRTYDRASGERLQEFSADFVHYATTDGLLVLSKTGELTGFDPRTGDRLWSTPQDRTAAARPTVISAVTDNTLFGTDPESSTSEFVTAIDTETGERQWTRTDLTANHPCAAADDVLVFLAGQRGEEKTLYGVDTATGETNWTTTVTEPFVSMAPVANESVVVAEGDGTLTLFDLSDGTVRDTVRPEELPFFGLVTEQLFFECGPGVTAYDIGTE
jgi:outer membrane protein assembly factor BamB